VHFVVNIKCDNNRTLMSKQLKVAATEEPDTQGNYVMLTLYQRYRS